MNGWVVINKKLRETKGVLESAILNQGCLVIYLSKGNADKWFKDGIADSRKKQHEIAEIEVYSK